MAKSSRVAEIRPQQIREVPNKASRSALALPAATRGRIVSWTEDGLYVSYGEETSPLRAESLVSWTAEELREAVAAEAPVLLVFEDGDPLRPMIVGLPRPLPVPAPPVSTPAPAVEPAAPMQARVDGQRVEFSAQDEVVLRCGEASITLRRNGRVVIKGAYVETRSRGTHRIKGGHVLIN